MTLKNLTLTDLITEFDELGDWEARCEHLIDLGREIPPMATSEKIEANLVHGCQSNVWLVAELTTLPPQATPATGQPGTAVAVEPVLSLRANSDAMIVSGLIAVLMLVFNGRTPREILDTDVLAIFKRLELDRHLSSQRRNGLFGMVQRVRHLAATASQVAVPRVSL